MRNFKLKIGVITLFPAMFEALDESIPGRAQQKGALELLIFNPRDYTEDKAKQVDDRPYGGGPGMVMMAEPLMRAIEAAKQACPLAQVAYLSPQGQCLTQASVGEISERRELILICGRYEGIDERVIEHAVDVELSIGDYVVSGGELPAMIVIDAVTRLLPGVLGDADSAAEDSFSDGLLDCPHYTRPESWRGQAVPPVLLSGHHGQIAQWRRAEQIKRTELRRPELVHRHNSLGEKT